MQEGRVALPRSRSDSRQLKQQGKHKRLPGIEGGIAAYPGNHANQRECRTSEVWLCKHSSMSEPEKGWGWWTMRCQQAKQPSPDPALIRQLKSRARWQCTKQPYLNKAATPETHTFRPGHTPGTTWAYPNYSQPARTSQHTVYTEITFSRQGEIVYSI